jgi:hypothetical protein
MGSGSHDPTSIEYKVSVHELNLGFLLSRIVCHKLILMHIDMNIDYFQPIVGFLSSKRRKSKTGRKTTDRIFKFLRSPGIDSKKSISTLAGRYDDPIPTRFLAPIDCLNSSSTILNVS